MTSLSIVERELRVRARQRLTFWLRVGVAGTAMLMSLLWLQYASRASPAETSRMVFGLLTWLCFALCLFEGARQTADTISGEKREGTLGLLFLTDLDGLDIALGKFAAASVQSFYGLLAVFPVLGITLAVGGVTAGEFWRTQLALLTTLFLAAAGGLWVSARSHDELRAVLAVVGLMLGLVLVPLAYDAVAGLPALPSLSPAAGVWLAGDMAYRATPNRFWLTQVALAGLGAVFLLSAGRETARSWREPAVPQRPRTKSKPHSGWNYRVTPRLHARPSLPATSPIDWPAASQRGRTPLIWLALMLPALNLVGVQFLFRIFGSSMQTAGVLSFLNIGLNVLSVALLALVAARPLLESRRSGALELLLCTPVTGEQIARGHWAYLWSKVRLPLALYVVVPVGLCLWFWLNQVSRGGTGAWNYYLPMQLLALSAQVVKVLATCWLGLWLGVAARTTGQAVGRALLLVMLVPWVAGTALSLLLGFWVSRIPTGQPQWWQWLAWTSGSIVSLAWLAGLTVWARRRLFHRFRETVAGETQSRPGFLAWPRKTSLAPPVSA